MDQFVKVRVVRMNDVDLGLFQFDYDLTWAGFVMNPQGHIYARYGTRWDENAERQVSVAGLKTTLSAALEAFRAAPDAKPSKWASRPASTLRSMPDDIRSGARCLHCHQVWQYAREDQAKARTFVKKDVPKVYPLADNLGFTLEVDRATVVATVDAKGAAGKAGLAVGDRLVTADGVPVRSGADLSHALHLHTGTSPIAVTVSRGDTTKDLKIAATGDWRSRGISWRGSLWPIEPRPGFWGKDLTADEKQQNGIPADQLALKLGGCGPGLPGAKAGLKVGDVLVEVAGRRDLTGPEVQAFLRLEFEAGATVPLVVLRNGKPEKIALKLFVK